MKSGLMMLVCSLAVGCNSDPKPPPSDCTLYVNGKIWQGKGKPDAEAMAECDGRILAVGSRSVVSATNEAKAAPVVDLHGKRAVPALIDAHSHPERFAKPEWLANGTEWVERGEFGPTADEVRAALIAKAAHLPEGSPVIVFVGINWYSTAPKDVRAWLDSFVPNHLALVLDWGGHGIAVNSKLLAEVGYVDGMPDSETGRVGRDASGRLTGVVQEMMELPIFKRITRELPDDFLVDGLVEYGNAWAAFGGGRVYDINFAVGDDRIDRIRAAVGGKTLVDFVPVDILTSTQTRPGPHSTQGRRVWKVFVDGAPGDCSMSRSRLPPLAYPSPETCPYAFEVPYWGANDVTSDFIAKVLRDAREQNATVLFHALGDGGVDHFLDALDRVGGGSWRGRVSMEHGDLVTRGQLARLKAHGVPLVQNATHLLSVSNLTVRRFDAASMADTELLQSALDAGVELAFGTDAFSYPTSPWLEMQIAVSHPFNPKEAISREDFLAGYTSVAAMARGQGDKARGTLEAGQPASFAVLSQDVLDAESVPLSALPATTSVLTVINGEVAYSDGSLMTR